MSLVPLYFPLRQPLSHFHLTSPAFERKKKIYFPVRFLELSNLFYFTIYDYFNRLLFSKDLFSFIEFSLPLPLKLYLPPLPLSMKHHHLFSSMFPHSFPLFILLLWGLSLIISCCREKGRTHTVGTACGKQCSREGRTAFVLPSAGRLRSCQQGPNPHWVRKTQIQRKKKKNWE